MLPFTTVPFVSCNTSWTKRSCSLILGFPKITPVPNSRHFSVTCLETSRTVHHGMRPLCLYVDRFRISCLVNHSVRPLCLSAYKNIATTTLRGRCLNTVVHQRAKSDHAKPKGKKPKGKKPIVKGAEIDGVNLPTDCIEKILALDQFDLVNVVATLVSKGKITPSQIKQGLPSFSAAKWDELAPSLGFSNLASMTFQPYGIDSVLLPPSFHVATTKAAWRIQDVYQEILAQDREEARIRVFDAYLVPMVGLFQGRIVDKPEHPMMSTAYSSGGDVEHELIMIGGVLFFIIEKKFNCDGRDNVSQLFLELLSAAEMNKRAKFEGLQIYGLLTDLQMFHFYSYDPVQKEFAFDETLITNVSRDGFIKDMIHVTNKVFSVILFAFVKGLAVLAKASHKRALKTTASSAQQLLKNIDDKNKQYEVALSLGQQCISKFQEPVKSIKDIERNGTKAIELLTKSVRSIPRVSLYSGKEDPATEKDVAVLAYNVVHTEYTTLIDKSHHN